ncbi:MAG: hypothetical protein A2W98_11285 [Bacteroidetes bacterium GWF2_33_38]|nr:MAG: hypothetical protein A2W98_11285 [Bacteroidetes bacterium GWF2_33_38]OFY86778.1 MAG: hypothetical protein A2236_10425 [Bacteroidetes bacterium RIFOXYA2_FULL_33_7]
MEFVLVDIVSVFMVMFAVIDIPGSIPIIIDIKAKNGNISALKVTLASFLIFILFLFGGERILELFGVDVSSFAIAGSFIIFLISLEMVLGIELFKQDTTGGSSIVPIAFPLVAGAGSITTLLSLRAAYSTQDIIVAIALNMIIVYFVLRSTRIIEKVLGKTGTHILRKVFGIILLAIAVKLFLSNTGIVLGK